MISLKNLTVTYGGLTAVDDVTFDALPGRVTGFLGPNGAGKSTTMRVIVGLTRADHGTATVGGHRYRDLPNPGRRVGVLLDASAQHDGRTGREVLTLGAQTLGLPTSRVDELLDLVSLSPAESRRRVRTYSLGMRQRLGIAHTLLGDPSVLILDEPANGLDPAGIHWMRGLLTSYAERGGTVLLSSHLLHEVEVIADELVLIGHGRIVASGDKASLLAVSRGASTQVVSQDNHALATALVQRGITFTPDGASLLVEAEPAHVGKVALEAAVVLTDLRSAGGNLEDLFLKLTSNTQRDISRRDSSRGDDERNDTLISQGAPA
jgi:ABC-2 type transport system ATP-binding protein